MAEILQLNPNYGLQVTYTFNNQVSPLYVNDDYVNSQWEQPLANYIFGLAWFDQSVYDYVESLFLTIKGSEQTFLFEDPFDYKATNDPKITPYSTGTQGVVVESSGQFQLAKQYQLIHGGGTAFITRPITRPKDTTVTVYDDLGAPTSITVDPDTGILSSGGTGYTWEGEFYTPVRLLNNRIPQEIISYDPQVNQQLYRLPDLRLREVRETNFKQSRALFPSLDHYYQLSFEYQNAIDQFGKADIFTASSGFEDRDDLDINRKYLTLSESLLGEDEKDYLITLWRITLGGSSNFKFQDTNANIDDNFRLLSPLSFLTLSDNPSDTSAEFGTYQCFGLELIEEVTPKKSRYCRLWKITKVDLTIVGFTDHDQEIVYDSVTYSPNLGFTGGASSNTAQLNTDSAEINSTFTPLGLTESDILSGRLEDADLEYFLFNWETNTLIKVLFNGNLGGYSLGYLPSETKEYQFEALSLANKLDSSRRIVTSSTCSAKFLSQGERQCNRPIDTSVRETATVVTATDRTIVVSGIADASIYRLGTCRFTSGDLISLKEFLIGDTSGIDTILLFNFTPIIASPGDTIELTRFCDKTVDGNTGCEFYANQVNFVGIPEAPTADLAIAKAE